jgi:hypothetical protein
MAIEFSEEVEELLAYLDKHGAASLVNDECATVRQLFYRFYVDRENDPDHDSYAETDRHRN